MRVVRAVVAVAVAGVLALWGWNQFLTHSPPLSDEVATQLAQDEWDARFCYDHETEWPCIVTTNVSLDRSDDAYVFFGDEEKSRGAPYRRCFDLNFQVETTRWNYTYGGPDEPRTYVGSPEPVHVCANVTHDGGTSENPESWRFRSSDRFWYSEYVDALHRRLCASPPSGATYSCLP